MATFSILGFPVPGSFGFFVVEPLPPAHKSFPRFGVVEVGVLIKLLSFGFTPPSYLQSNSLSVSYVQFLSGIQVCETPPSLVYLVTLQLLRLKQKVVNYDVLWLYYIVE